jgi:hypothetical protein
MNILFNNIKKTMDQQILHLDLHKEIDKEKPIKKVESNLNKMIEDMECIKKDIADIFTILNEREKKKETIRDNGSWFLF